MINGHYYHIKLAPLAFVHRHSVGQLEFFEHVEVVMNALVVVLDCEPFSDKVDFFNYAHVAVKDPCSRLRRVLCLPHKVVVVFCLHHAVALAQNALPRLALGFVRRRRV